MDASLIILLSLLFFFLIALLSYVFFVAKTDLSYSLKFIIIVFPLIIFLGLLFGGYKAINSIESYSFKLPTGLIATLKKITPSKIEWKLGVVTFTGGEEEMLLSGKIIELKENEVGESRVTIGKGMTKVLVNIIEPQKQIELNEMLDREKGTFVRDNKMPQLEADDKAFALATFTLGDLDKYFIIPTKLRIFKTF